MDVIVRVYSHRPVVLRLGLLAIRKSRAPNCKYIFALPCAIACQVSQINNRNLFRF